MFGMSARKTNSLALALSLLAGGRGDYWTVNEFVYRTGFGNSVALLQLKGLV